MKISKFKPGDNITRIDPRYWFDEDGGSGAHTDGSFIGLQIIFKGIANGCIIIGLEGLLFSPVISLPLYSWDDDNWDYWVDPKKLHAKKVKNKSKHDYEVEIAKLVSQEKYEIAEKLKQEMIKKFSS